MKNIIKQLTTLAILCIPMMAIAGGGWPQPKGKAYIKLSEWWQISDQHYTSAGFIDPNVTLALYNTNIYAEYGITDRFTTTVYMPIFSRSVVNTLVSNTTKQVIEEGDAINSIGDAEISLKYGLTRPGSKFALAASIKLGLPTGVAAGGINNNLQTGDGEFNQQVQLDLGRSFQAGTASIYGNLYGAFNNRTNDFSDEVRTGLELGLGLVSEKIWLISRLDVLQSLQNGATAESITTSGIFANNAEFTTLGIEANYYFTPKVGVSANVTTPLSGKIILAGPSYSVGIFLDLSK